MHHYTMDVHLQKSGKIRVPAAGTNLNLVVREQAYVLIRDKRVCARIRSLRLSIRYRGLCEIMSAHGSWSGLTLHRSHRQLPAIDTFSSEIFCLQEDRKLLYIT